MGTAIQQTRAQDRTPGLCGSQDPVLVIKLLRGVTQQGGHRGRTLDHRAQPQLGYNLLCDLGHIQFPQLSLPNVVHVACEFGRSGSIPPSAPSSTTPGFCKHPGETPQHPHRCSEPFAHTRAARSSQPRGLGLNCNLNDAEDGGQSMFPAPGQHSGLRNKSQLVKTCVQVSGSQVRA